ncbi:Methyltransferase domain-containing protein [Marinitoga hydrogenitolerans DSM 16785]|uniref:site-specific DNA-methyltransferase (adenine-specific) n=1 Tax=Marinitoga hydrogenitolerans (strain DSM 16785 / JCM 12826 / AT1271) TaxID=1122195 RepID=A0A1M4Z0N0_MARH1|nr:Eco57I restriction-modification methylase domain-containing protein [Marinitoga hydrogenitolerans]SHF11619.1 Methyltransferase domain-containing protein [Marinitoga hydrogenitolerans DSM 16785]
MYENLKNTIQKIKNMIKESIELKLEKLGFYKNSYNPTFNRTIINKINFNMLKEYFFENYKEQREKYIENYTFNYLNKIIALKMLNEKGILKGYNDFIELKNNIPELFEDIYEIKLDKDSFYNIINEIEKVKDWHKEDILGWAYQYYNINEERSKLFEQSQFYTPEWVVEYLVDNTLTKYYCELYDDFEIANKYKIKYKKREYKKRLESIKILDPACGSGHFLIKIYDRLKEFYEKQGYSKDKYIKNIIEKNIYGMDIDERSVEIAKIILKIKTLIDGYNGNLNFNLVSTNFEMIQSEDIEDNELKQVYDAVKDELEGYEELGSLIILSNKSKEMIKKLQKRNIIPLFEEKTHLEKYYVDKLKKFFKILVLNYDIVISNPPYTDSHDYTPNLRKHIRKKYFDFRKNLYACFIKRNYDFLIKDGLLGMITPQTFMFISSYEKLREFIIKNIHIEKLVHFGLGGVFEDAFVDTAMYILRKNKNIKEKGIYINLNDISYEKKRYELEEISKKLYYNKYSEKVFEIDQREFKKIPRIPFVYWVNDEIKKIFEYDKLIKYADVRQGIATGDNKRFLRYHWQVPRDEISFNHKKDKKKWVPYVKGGPYNKWFGNLWWVIAFDEENYNQLKKMGNHLPNKQYYFKSGITYSMTTSKGPTFRILPENFLFDCKGSSIFTEDEKFRYALLGFLNSKLAFYLYKFIAGSVDLEVGDLKQIPIATRLVKNNKKRDLLIDIVKLIISIKKQNTDYSPLELHYNGSPLHKNLEGDFESRILKILQTKDLLDTYLLMLEALIEKIIFQTYSLKKDTIKDIYNKERIPAGWMPITDFEKLPSLNKFLKNDYINISIRRIEEIENEIYRFLKHLKLQVTPINMETVYELYSKKGREEYDNIIERISLKENINPISIYNIIKDKYDLKKDYRVKKILFLAVNEEFLKNKGEYKDIKKGLEKIGITENHIKKYLNTTLKKYINNKFLKEQFNYYKKTIPYWSG